MNPISLLLQTAPAISGATGLAGWISQNQVTAALIVAAIVVLAIVIAVLATRKPGALPPPQNEREKPLDTSPEAKPAGETPLGVVPIAPTAESIKVEKAEKIERERTLAEGLQKTRGGVFAKISDLFLKKELKPEIADELEELLYEADLGPKVIELLLKGMRQRLTSKDLGDPAAARDYVKAELLRVLTVSAPPWLYGTSPTKVVFIVGVNGVGKTTTIGKLAARYAAEGKKVVVGAADTFRAAAVEQLEVWAKRAGCDVIKGREGGDPSSVIFDAVAAGKSRNADIVICDTAGRLQTKVNLVEELKKMKRTADKALQGAPHELLLVLDGTTGQNALSQAKAFHEALNLTGLVITKLDGTAKGGAVIGIVDTLRLPVRFIGIGEGVHDLRIFDAKAFVDALFDGDDAAASSAA